MRYYEIITEIGAAGSIKPAAPTKPTGTSRYQTKPVKRARYQSDNDDRWQTPPTTPRPAERPSKL